MLTGKYAVISAQSDRPVDVNLDGQSSKDMLIELPALKNTFLGLNVNNSSIFELFWPRESFHSRDGRVVPTEYDPSLLLNYENVPMIGYYSYDAERGSLSIDRIPENEKPESVVAKGNGIIEVTITRNTYTRSGWEDLRFTILYERFTMDF